MTNCTHVAKRCWPTLSCRKIALPNVQGDSEETECHQKPMARNMQSKKETLKSHILCRLCWAHKFSSKGLNTIPASNECYSERKKKYLQFLISTRTWHICQCCRQYNWQDNENNGCTLPSTFWCEAFPKLESWLWEMAWVGAAQVVTDGQDWNGRPEWQGTSETVTRKELWRVLF